MIVKHVDRYPFAPTADQQVLVRLLQRVDHLASGLQYRTGPRYGQQLATARKAAR